MNIKHFISLFVISVLFSFESMAEMVCTGPVTFSYDANGYTITYSDGYTISCSNDDWSQECDDFQDNVGYKDFFAMAMVPFGENVLKNYLTWDAAMSPNSDSGNETQNGTSGNDNTIVKNADGSYTLYNEDGTIKGFKNKRIYTIEEATLLSKETGNIIKLRYK